MLQLGCALGVLLLGSFHVCFVLSHDGDEYEVKLYQGRGKEKASKTETRRGSAVGRATRRWLGGYEKGIWHVQSMKPALGRDAQGGAGRVARPRPRALGGVLGRARRAGGGGGAPPSAPAAPQRLEGLGFGGNDVTDQPTAAPGGRGS